MTMHYGKRNAGSLTAAAPGDTIHIPFATYNDSGASITDTGFSHNQVEIYKNGFGTARATDSGVWLGDSGVNYYVAAARVAVNALSDSGLISGDVKGIYSIAIRLFNTTDDTGFYDAGSHYTVVVQDFKILGNAGHTKLVNFIAAHFEIDGARKDTAYIDAGNQGFVGSMMKGVKTDTGAAHIASGRLSGLITATAINNIWASDTGIRQLITRADTGIRVHMDVFDTGSRTAISQISATVDTGLVSDAVWGKRTPGESQRLVTDTGVRHLILEVDTGISAQLDIIQDFDTGMRAKIDRMDTGKLDTGRVSRAVWNSLRADHIVAASFGKSVADSGQVRDVDTGIMSAIADLKGKLDTGHDTGIIVSAVWNALRADHVVASSFGRDLADSGKVAAVADTGKITVAVWGALRASHVVAASFGKSVADSGQIRDVDTGIMAAIADLKAKLDTGHDTGIIVNAVWDAVLTGASHNDATSAGKHLRQAAAYIAAESTVNDTGTATPNATTLAFRTDLTEVTDDHYRDQTLIFTSGALLGQARVIEVYDGTTMEVSFTEAFTDIPADADAFTIIADHIHTESRIAGSVWDEEDTGHFAAGTMGARLRDTGGHSDLHRILAKLDTGVTLQDTGLYALINRMDTGIRVHMDVFDTGMRNHILEIDTGIMGAIADLKGKLDTGHDTGIIVNAVWNALRAVHTVADSFGKTLADTGHIKDVDTGLSKALVDIDTGLRLRINDLDTGLRNMIVEVDTGLSAQLTLIQTVTDKFVFTTANEVDANIQSVNDVAVQGAGDTGTNNPWRPV